MSDSNKHSGETDTAPAVERLSLSALVDGGTTALLQTDDHCEVRVPIFLLPEGAGIGSVLRMALTLDNETHRERVNQMIELQQAILDDRLLARPQ